MGALLLASERCKSRCGKPRLDAFRSHLAWRGCVWQGLMISALGATAPTAGFLGIQIGRVRVGRGRFSFGRVGSGSVWPGKSRVADGSTEGNSLPAALSGVVMAWSVEDRQVTARLG